jgi:hypothetical protein
MANQLHAAECGTARTPRPHKRVRWRLPGGKRRPGVLDATRAALVRALQGREGALWARIRSVAPIAGYAAARALARVRCLRGDGAESLLAMLIALLYLADVRTGFIGTPRPERGHWKRYTLADLSQLAFGGQTEADIRRARRAIAVLIGLGWAFPTRQVRRYTTAASGGEGFASDPAIRRLNLDRLCEMVGTTWLLKRDRIHADRTKGKLRAALHAAVQRRTDASPDAASSERHRPAPLHSGPPRAGGPISARDAVLAHLSRIQALLA